MTHKTPPRIGMPEVSNMAHKMLAKSPSYNKPLNQENIKPVNKQEQEATLESCRIAKQEMLPRLKELKQILDSAEIAHQIALDNWRQLSQEYERIDYKEKLIIHEQKVVIKSKTSSTKEAASTEESAKKLAMKALANLSPDKLAKILALIKKQSS